MKLSVRNLGRIREAEVDIRPLTVFVGQNDTNKTWLSYAFAALANRVSCTPDRAFETAVDGPQDLTDAIRRVTDQIGERYADRRSNILVRVVIDLSPFLKTIGPNVRLTAYDYELRNWFGLPPNLLLGAEASLEVPTAAAWGNRYQSLQLLYSALERVADGVESNTFQFRVEPGDKTQQFVVEAPPALYHDQVWNEVQTALARFATVTFDRMFYFPSDRVGLARIRDYLQPEFFRTTPSDAASPFPRPLINFCEWYKLALTRHTPFTREAVEATDYLRLFENQILGGELVVDSTRSQLAYRPHGAPLEFPLQQTSSMVSALSCLGLYLRGGVYPFDCLIIDEPELDAHPEAQLQVLELLAMLANSGVQVVITTHSPYLLDHLHDLMEAARLTPERQAEVAGRFKLGESKAFIDAEKVAVYEFVKEGASVAVNSVLDRTDSLIDTATFSNPTNYLNDLYPDLLQLSPAEQAE